MKNKSVIVAVILHIAFLAGCSVGPAERRVYRESQFASRLEYLRFCQRYEMRTGRCV